MGNAGSRGGDNGQAQRDDGGGRRGNETGGKGARGVGCAD